MNEIKIISTRDGFNTVYSGEYNEHYHSINGAAAESEHIYINLGLKKFKNRQVNILEIGYGTGLNAILSYLANEYLDNHIFYHAIDTVRLENEIIREIGYGEKLNIKPEIFWRFYEEWNTEIKIDQKFILLKNNINLNDFNPDKEYNIIYFDAFSPETQPEMWEYKNLQRIITRLDKGGIFVTYCSKGIVKQTLRDCGLDVKRVVGPAGKRHVIYAVKN
ncbi:MAG: tRNA (5-methylaminomethyl-2-thiouridine)(34)-methyltransferase MnmD [Bacteroidales bacterium]|jgi:tRNA U34 5-methylaminomethyl-2-thiouridine-forming methyltransferase MnmC|nr:tRNA (5-methylaminomethyl-2-thiouridine)(34)-methyltransferase MnmD [Bacteroidales bacterium]